MYYNARFYDPYLNHFTQPDSIVPDPSNSQAWDRYAYAFNNPIRYNDPSGHCPRYQKDEDNSCLEQLHDTQDKFGVVIDDSKGSWTSDLLGAISKGMGTLQGRMGKDAFAKLFTGVTFEVGGGNVDPKGLGTTGNMDIHVGEAVTGLTYLEKETVHELSHIWDNSCNDCMSKGMMKATGGTQYKKYLFFGDDVYIPGTTPPTPHANLNRREDWAESVTAYFYPSYAFITHPLRQDRIDYIVNALSNPY
jgi:hypothetical protein